MEEASLKFFYTIVMMLQHISRLVAFCYSAYLLKNCFRKIDFGTYEYNVIEKFDDIRYIEYSNAAVCCVSVPRDRSCIDESINLFIRDAVCKYDAFLQLFMALPLYLGKPC